MSRARHKFEVVVLGHALDRAPKRATYDRPLVIRDVIRRQRLEFRLPTVAVVVPADGGEPLPVLRRDWHRRVVGSGETLLFVPVPRGGSGGSLLATIAAIALSVVAGPAGLAVSQALFAGSAMAAALVSAGIIVAGSFLINALMPKPPAPAEAERVHLARASSNRALPLGTIPAAYGLMRFAPPLAAVPYAEFEGNDQVLYQLHCPSVGKWVPKRWEIGKTLAWASGDGFTEAFTDIRMQIVHPGGDLTLFPANVVVADTAGAVVPDPPATLGPVTVNAAGTEISRIGVDLVFPAGLYKRASGGGASNATRRVIARARPIDGDGNPTGGYAVLFDETFTRKTPTPQRFTRHADVTPGRYEVTVEATDADTTDAGETINRVVWAGLRGYLTNWTLPEGVTLIATAIRANDQISQQSANEYFFTGQRCLPVWDGEAWSEPVETRAIAWAAADILRNADYGAGLDDGRFDLDWLAAYNTLWAGRGDRFDGVFDRAVPVRDALDQVLRTGRAYHVRLGGRIGFVRDEPKHVRRHVFGPWNTLRDSHIRDDQWLDDERPGQLRVRYLDETVWAEREVMAAIAGNGATPAESRFLFGMTDRDHAWREGIYDAAANEYRRSFRLFQVEHEGRQLVRGDAVLYHDPMLEEAAPARLVARDGDTFTIDRDFAPEDGETYHLIVRDKRGREWGPVVIDSFPDARTIALDAADRLVVESQHGLLDEVLPDERSEPAWLSILAGEHRLFDGLIVSARPAGERWWEVLIVNDDQRVHLADETEIIPAPYTPPELFQPPPEAPAIDASSLYARARNGTMHIELEAGWRPAPGAQRYVAEISYDDDAESAPDGASWTPVHDGVGTRFTAVIMPNDWTLRVAAIGVRQGLWRTVSGTSPAPLLAPGTVGEESLDPVVATLIRHLKSNSQAWIGLIREEALAAIENMAAANGGAYAFNEDQINQVASIIGHRVGENEASITRVDRAVADIDRALAEIYVDVLATVPGASAESLYQLIASAGPEGAIVALEERLRAGFGGVLAEAARGMEVYAGEGGAFSRLWFRGDRFDIIDGQGIRRNALLFPVADEQDVEITVEGSDNVIRPDLRGRALRHYCLLTANAELRPPVGAVPMDYTVRVEQDATSGRTISASDEYLHPKPELSGAALLPGAISIIEHSILSINPLRIAATVSEPFTETPTVAFRAFRQQTTGSTSGQLTTTPVGLNYVPGNAIVAICTQHRRNTAEASVQNIASAAVDGWNEIDIGLGGHSGGGGQFRAIGTRAFLRFADGNEGAFQPFQHSGEGPFFTELTTHYFSLNFLGGTLSLCDDPTADAGSTSGSTWNHTIKTDGFDPAIAFSIAAIANGSGTEPDQAFSETPDQNRTTFAFGLGNFWLNVRSKVTFFDTEADDVTTSLTAPGGTGVRSLISFGLKME